MANEGERSTSADKGKGKVEDVRELHGKKPQKDEKTTADGKKKDEEPQQGMSSRPGSASRSSVLSVSISHPRMLTYVKMSLVRRISN